MLDRASLAGIVATARGVAESVMVDACTVRGVSTGTVWHPATGRDVPALGPHLYSGPCRVQVPDFQTHEDDVGGHQWLTRQVVVSVPVGAVEIGEGAVVEVTAAAFDPVLVGRRYRVVSALVKTAGSARRLSCEEVIR